MKYQYNYSFLEQWLQANRDIQKKDVLRALGIKSNNGLKAWTDGRGPMPVLNILRFCNSFQVPLACFFKDEDAEGACDLVPEMPSVNDQLEPFGGYDNGERGRGERYYDDPTNCEMRSSHVPGFATIRKIEGSDEGLATGRSMDDGRKKDDGGATVSNKEKVVERIMKVIDTDALIALENKHADQRDRLLDIIAEQQKQIADMTRIIEQYSARPYSVVKEYGESDLAMLVAEDVKRK